MTEITIAGAKKIVKAFLEKHSLPYTKLTGKKVSFSDLARCKYIFIRVHGWQPCPQWGKLEEAARLHGFYVEV